MREGAMGKSATTSGIGVEDFAALYDRHRGRVYAQCLRRLRSPADADDATQVTFLRAFMAINRGNGPRRLGPWLATIARNECSDRLSAAGKAVPMDMAELVLADDGPEPDARVLAEAEGAEVRAALEHLPFAQRSALHLREVCELSYAEVAERLAIPVTAVETLLFRARGNLRDEILALRSPVKCHRARELGESVRDGAAISALERKVLRNHRSECALCSWLPVRRARGARAAAVLVATAAAATARRLVLAPVADALVSAGAPAKTAAVAVAAGGVAAGGLAVERPRPAGAPENPAAQVRKAPQRQAGAPTAAQRATPAVTLPARSTTPTRTAAANPARPVTTPTRRAGRAPAATVPAVQREPTAERQRRRAPTREPHQQQPRVYDQPQPRTYERRSAPPVHQEQPTAEAASGPCARGEASEPGPAPSGGEPGAHRVTDWVTFTALGPLSPTRRRS